MIHKGGKIWNCDDQSFRELIAKCTTITQALSSLGLKNKGGNNTSIKTRIAELRIDTSHFDPRKFNTGNLQNKPLSEKEVWDVVLIKDSRKSRKCLRTYLRRYNLLEHVCADCGLTDTWNGKPIVLHIEHKNGVSNDNRIENLEWLCPNCHSQTDTYAGKNNKKLTVL